MPIPSLSELLKRMVDSSGSDLHITTDTPPQIRVHGHMKPLDLPPPIASEHALRQHVEALGRQHNLLATFEVAGIGSHRLPRRQVRHPVRQMDPNMPAAPRLPD